MERHDKHLGWLFAAFTVLVWGSTFISSKKLLQLYTPSQIMLMRFLLAYAALWLLRPRRMKLSLREEGAFLLMGLAGCSLYFYTENTALTHTLAANVSIIVAAAPIFTAILAHFVGEERFSRRTLLGFLIAFTGVILVVFNGAFVLKLDPRGDLLALGAAACWAVYSILLRRMGGRHDPLLVTRRTLFWGTVTAIPIVLLEGAPFPTARWPHRPSPGISCSWDLSAADFAMCSGTTPSGCWGWFPPTTSSISFPLSPLWRQPSFWTKPSLPSPSWAPPSSPQALW